MRTIKLAIFNEDYWSKGLIYTQNILPLKSLSKETNSKFEIVSFTSLPLYIQKYKDIKNSCEEMRKNGIVVHNYFVLYYPTRMLVARWFIIPFLFLNTMFYLWYLRIKDYNKDVVYNLRSYQVALCFYKFYGNHKKLFFDTRTDYIEEGINSGFFEKNSLTEKLWLKYERQMLKDLRKTIFISDVFKMNVMKRHSFTDESKMTVLYNPIDYNLFYRKREPHKDVVFLYTGSLGRWNKLETYLNFFIGYHAFNSKSKLIICTNAPRDKVTAIMNSVQYSSIRRNVAVYYNVPIHELPNYYAQCDYGLQLMMKKDSRVGVKVVEYIASGVMPIIHENVQGAAEIARKYNLGIVISENDTYKTIFEKLSKTPRLDVMSEGYKSFQNSTDLNKINGILYKIFFC